MWLTPLLERCTKQEGFHLIFDHRAVQHGAHRKRTPPSRFSILVAGFDWLVVLVFWCQVV